MSENTKIEWADHTVNFWAGCSKVSPACDNCYAEKLAGRLWKVKWGAGKPRRFFDGACETLGRLDRKAQRDGVKARVFINSLSDVFDTGVGDEDRADAFEAMSLFENLTFLILTKRIGNVARYLRSDKVAQALFASGAAHLGITICNQAEADRDIPKLLAVPAKVLFLSVEPMLGPIQLNSPTIADPLSGGHVPPLTGLDWVICGGESGPRARPMHPDWARSLRDQCADAGVPFLFKQWGEWAEFNGDKPNRTVRVESDIGETLAARCDGFISRAGEFIHNMGEATTDDPYRGMQRVGKKKAGRLLDGIEHNEFPRVSP